MTSVTGLSHLTLAVVNLDRSITFYRDLLGLRLRAIWTNGAYLDAGDLWLCLAREDGPIAPREDYTHFALSIGADTFDELASRLRAAAPIWKPDSSEGKSLYFLDPDGHKLELHVGSLETRLAHYRGEPDSGVTIV